MDTKDASDAKKFAKPIVSHLRQEREKRAWTQSKVAELIGSTRINVSRWENGITSPGPYYRQELGKLFGKSVQELGLIPEDGEERAEGIPTLADTISPPSSTPPSPMWNMPYRRNPYFTGREAILKYLYTILRGRKSVALTQTQAISGLGGIGKTQIAVEYAYRYREQYQAIFWIDASTREVFSNHFLQLAAWLGLSEQHEQNQDIIVRAVKRWLSVHTQWLLILDNVETLEMIVDFLPTDITGDVLLTTRLQALGTVAQSIEVEKMELDEGVVFLLRRAKVIAADASLDEAMEESQAQATKIVAMMDGLPLALDQAAAYIEETHCGLAQYLTLFATRRKELLLRRGRLPVGHPEAVTTTWSLSFQRVEQESVASTELLRLFAFLNSEAIPEEIITLGAGELGPTLGAVASDPLQMNSIIELLLRYSLIRRNPEANSLSMHRLVQAVLVDGMDTETQRVWAERTIRAVNCAFPNVELQTWQRCQRLLPHVQMCATYIEKYTLAFPESARLLSEAASYLISRGSYGQAEQLLLSALEIRQKILEANHPDHARTLNDLGALYQSQGKYQKAEILLQEALAIRLQVLGEEHLEVAETLHNLANLYRAKGAYTKAEPFYLKALHRRETILGTDHPLTTQSYYGLAKLYHSLEKYQEAEMLCTQALRIQEQRLGSTHPMVASTLNMLAKIYQGQNKLDLAEEMNLRALSIRESTSGVDHPHVATIANCLVEIYHAKGQYHDVEALIATSLKIHEQSLGAEHPFMAYSLSNRATNLLLRGDYVQAESYFKMALVIREQNLGADHPHTASTYYELAKLYALVGRDEEAESFYRKALAIREHAFGLDHLIVARTLEQYANLLNKLKRTPEACTLEARIQAIKARQSALESP